MHTRDYFSKIKVFYLLAFGILAISFSPILVRVATSSSPYLIATVRTGFAFMLLFPFYLSQNNNKGLQYLSKNDHFLVVISGILLGLHLIAWISSIYFTSIASASVLVAIHPIIIIIFERFVFRTRFIGSVWVGVIIAFIGSVIIAYSDFDGDTNYLNPLLGNSLAAFAAVIFAGYFLIGNRIRQRRKWINYVFPVYGYAALTCLLALIFVDGFKHEFTLVVALVGFGLAIGPQIAGHGALNYAVKYISPTLLSTLILFEPIISSFLAFFIFGEIPYLLTFVGMVIVFIGIVLTWTTSNSNT